MRPGFGSSPNTAVFTSGDSATARAKRRASSTPMAPAFEAITVDGCTSTNDTVLLFASGAAGGPTLAPGDDGWAVLANAVAGVGASLAGQLIQDGEGVSHVLIVDVVGAAGTEDARRLSRAVAE